MEAELEELLDNSQNMETWNWIDHIGHLSFTTFISALSTNVLHNYNQLPFTPMQTEDITALDDLFNTVTAYIAPSAIVPQILAAGAATAFATSAVGLLSIMMTKDNLYLHHPSQWRDTYMLQRASANPFTRASKVTLDLTQMGSGAVYIPHFTIDRLERHEDNMDPQWLRITGQLPDTTYLEIEPYVPKDQRHILPDSPGTVAMLFAPDERYSPQLAYMREL